MKQLVTFLAIGVISLNSFAQVGINTVNPNASAALDISSSNKGLLIPRVSLINYLDNTTIASPASGLMIYNNNNNINGTPGFFFNAGTPASPSWTRLSDLVMPYYKGTAVPGAAFTIENYGGQATASAIKAYSQNGYALETTGKIKFAGSSMEPSLGKVLTCDADGVASWQGAIGFSAKGVVGNGMFANITENTVVKVPFLTVDYDLSSNYNNTTVSPHSTFIAPVKGIYHFDAQLLYISSAVDYPAILLYMKRGATTTYVAGYQTQEEDTNQMQLSLSKDLLLEPGDEVYIATKHYSDDYRSLSTSGATNWFSGRLVVKL